jgi:predicted RNase H-like nuclease
MGRSSQPGWQAAPVAVLGVDGWRGAWVGAVLDGRSVRLLALPDVAAVLAVPAVDVVAIDMPIGLSEDGARVCDVRARDLLRPTGAASSVFPTPVRGVLGTDDYAEARALSRAATTPPRAPSAQAFQLVRAIRALDDALGDPPSERVVEVHPELAFRLGLGGVVDRKGTARGTVQRLRALGPVMDVLDALADAPPGVPVVDALDACAAAWSAQRIALGRAECVGDGTTDSRGRPMRICW